MPDSIPRIGAAYIRVSTEDQVELSPDSQLRLIRDYASAHDIVIPDQFVFADDGISGRGTRKRDAFNKMIGTAKLTPRPFDVILLWKYSRFARNREDSVVYKSMLRKQLGIEVQSITEPTGDDKMSVLIEALIEAMDEYYSINLSEEVKRGMTEKALRGGLQSTPPFGYCVRDNMLVPVPEEAAAVREIFSRFCSGAGYLDLAKWLNAQGLRTHRGGAFENRTIEYIVHNPAYIGKLRWCPFRRIRRDYDNPDIIVSPSEHEPLIDQATWDAAQIRAAEIKARWRPHSRPASEMRDILSGLVRCSDCGGVMTIGRGAFQCMTYSKGRGCFSHHVSIDLIHEALLARLRRDVEITSPLSFRVVQKQVSPSPDRSVAEKNLSRLRTSLERLRAAYLDGAEELSDYKAAKQRINDQIAVITSGLEALDPPLDLSAQSKALRASIKDTLSVLDSPDSSDAVKREALQRCVDYCAWDKASRTLTVHYLLFLS